jgi:hypothetical protein
VSLPDPFADVQTNDPGRTIDAQFHDRVLDCGRRRQRRATEVFFNGMQQPTGAYFATLSDPPPVASPGGIPLVEGGRIIGAIGCSGATGAQDAVACNAGADTIR